VTKQLAEEIQEFKELCKNTTQVVAWYPHPAEVRGPFCRWLTVSEVAPEYEKNVGTRHDDAKYAAAAMNIAPKLVAYLEKIEALIAVEQMLGDNNE
jgi:hypothetical protein